VSLVAANLPTFAITQSIYYLMGTIAGVALAATL